MALHGGVDGDSGRLKIDAGSAASLVERIHAVEAGLAEEFFQLLVVDIGYYLEIPVFGLQECGTVISLPQPRVRNIQPETLRCVVRQHSGVSRQDRLDSQFCHAGEDSLLQFSIAGVPRGGIGTAPAFEIVHQPPGLECWSCNKFRGIGIRIAEAAEDIEPQCVRTDSSETQVDAVEGHPVEFLFPAGPVPEGHGIGECTVIEIIAVLRAGGTALRCGYRGQFCRKLRMHAVPAQVNAGIIFQVPVESCRCIDRAVSGYGDAAVGRLSQLEEMPGCGSVDPD